MMGTPAKGTRDTFEREFRSNAVGDTFVDPGQYFLRRPDTNEKLKRQAVKVGKSVSHSAVFRPSGGPKLVCHAEFEYHDNGPPERPKPEGKPNFLTRFTPEKFQKKIPYIEDLYENKEDLIKADFIARTRKILTPNKPYTTAVKQHGTFYPHYLTYGSLKEFPKVSSTVLETCFRK